MEKLNFPSFQFKIRENGNKREIFDLVRKKYITLTDEEWVRQNCIAFLINVLNYPVSHIAVEKKLIINGLNKRTDIVVYNLNIEIKMIIECKSTKVKITDEVFHQISRYNIGHKAQYLMVTNGLEHFCALINFKNNSYKFLDKIPDYNEIQY